MRAVFSPTFINSIQMDGGTYVYNPPSASDIFGSGYVICDKHPDKYIPVDFNFASLEYNVLTLLKKATETLRSCVGCLEVEAMKNTRFPEDAEL
jgi:hypothetical protein